MNWKAVSSQLFTRGALLAVAVFCYWLLRETPFFQITAGDAEGLNTFILLLGSIYAVMYAFVIYVIWGQFTDVEKFVMRECFSLDELLRFSRYMNPDSNRAIRRAVAEYSQAVLQSEWEALGKRERDTAAENCFLTLMTAVIRAAPANPEEAAIQQRLIDISREAGEHRDERITKSLTRIPPTLMGFVNSLSTRTQQFRGMPRSEAMRLSSPVPKGPTKRNAARRTPSSLSCANVPGRKKNRFNEHFWHSTLQIPRATCCKRPSFKMTQESATNGKRIKSGGGCTGEN
jgi:hypothetical protein